MGVGREKEKERFSILPVHHPAEVRSPPPTDFAEPHSNIPARPRIFRSLQELKEIHGEVPSIHRWVELDNVGTHLLL